MALLAPKIQGRVSKVLMSDIRQTSKYAKYIQVQGWKVEKITGVYYYLRKFPIIGYFCKVQRPNKLPSEKDIKSLRAKYPIFQIVVEPVDKKQAIALQNRGYRNIKAPYLPSKTLILDLTKSKNSLFNNLSKDARQSLKKTTNLPLFTDPTLKSFHDSWKKAVNLGRYVPKLSTLRALKQSFTHSSLFLSSHNMSIEQNYDSNYISGAIFLLADNTCYYWQAFTSPAGRTSLVQYQILWQGILWGKSKGAKCFDFEGIFDSRFPQKSWRGFSAFKKKFGGTTKIYPGAYSKLFLPF